MPAREPLPKWIPPPHPGTPKPIELNLPGSVLLVPDPVSPDHLLFMGIDTSGAPLFSVSEASKFFFARSAQWLRIQEGKGNLRLDGKDIRSSRTLSGARRFNLADIELMSFALFESTVLSWTQLRFVLALLNVQGKMWGYLL